MIESKFLPKVSIITPVRNGAPYIEDLILSVKEQDYPNFEHIIIDDGSQDDGETVAILKRYPHLKWWSRENKGQYSAMNEGLIAAEGEFVCFISSDDLMAEKAISQAVAWLSGHPEAAGVYGVTSYIDEYGKLLAIHYPFSKSPLRYYPYFFQLQHCSFYVSKTSLLQNKLTFNPDIKFVGDYDWILRIIKSNIQIGRINSVLSLIRVHRNQISTQNRVEIKKKHKELAVQYGFGGIRFKVLISFFNLGSFFLELRDAYQANRITGLKPVFHKWIFDKLIPRLRKNE
jgi:glycosyltransferase involved in cell wall biosynthesis